MSNAYLESVHHEFQRLKSLADRAIHQLQGDEFFAVPGAELNNSIALICKHVSGNQRSRWTDFLTTDGEKPDRNRDSEFVLETGDTQAALLGRWERGWDILFDALAPLTPAHLDQPVKIRGETLTVLDAIQRQLSHYAYHVGQIVTIARLHRGAEWTTLTVARGKSAEFNASPRPYLDPPPSLHNSEN